MAFEMPQISRPKDVGLLPQCLQRLRDAFQADIDKGIAPGAVVLVARHGKVACFEAFGVIATVGRAVEVITSFKRRPGPVTASSSR
jgi:hypothetical protein